MDFVLGTEWLYRDISNQIPVKKEPMGNAADHNDSDKENVPPKKVSFQILRNTNNKNNNNNKAFLSLRKISSSSRKWTLTTT